MDNLRRFGLMRPYTSGQANINPPKRVRRLRELMDTKAPSVCVLRGEGLGDVIMATPTIQALKDTFPEPAVVTFATNTRYLEGALVEVLKYNPSIDNVIDREQVDESDYDLVVNLHCPCVSYEKRENPSINRVDLFAAHAGVKLIDKVPKYYLQQDEVEWAKNWLTQNRIRESDKVIMVHVFTTTTRRNLNSKKFKDSLMTLAKKGYKLIILSHTTDHPSDVQFDNIPNSVMLSEDVRKVAAVASLVDLVLCPDSGILHLAGALATPTLSLFGHTDPHARINYYKNTVALWPGGGYSCAPCWSNACTMNEACYKAITTEMIVDACINQIKNKPKVKEISAPSNTIQIERI